MRRALALAICAAGSLPLCAASPWNVDAEGRIGGGRMPHLVPGGCGPSSRNVWYGGAGGRLEASPDPSPESRFVLAGEADMRVGVQDAAGRVRPRGVFLYRLSPTLGFDSEYFQIMVGAYMTNDQEREIILAAPSAMMRFGPRDTFWVAIDVFDEPACFVAQCVLGISYGAVFQDLVVLNQGFSLGVDGVRTWIRVPFVEGENWWQIGGEFGQWGDESGTSFALTLGLRTPWPTGP